MMVKDGLRTKLFRFILLAMVILMLVSWSETLGLFSSSASGFTISVKLRTPSATFLLSLGHQSVLGHPTDRYLLLLNFIESIFAQFPDT